MTDPFFSIVIPCYNSQDYIVETLASIRSQTFQDFEIILIDDHSSDVSLSLALDFFREYNIRGVAQKRDASVYPKGVSGCRNQGIDLAKGAWISFLDSDDLFYPQKLAKVHALILENPNIGIFHHAIREFSDQTGQTLQHLVLKDLQGPHQKLPNLLDGNNICTSTVTVSKSLMLAVQKFDKTLYGIEDYYAWLWISKLSTWYYDSEVLTSYRIRQESLMGFKPMKHYITQNTNLLKVLAGNPQFSHEEWKRLEKHLIYGVMSYYCNNSINKFGVWKTCWGLSNLIKHGYPSVAFTYILRTLKHYMLRKIFK